MSLPPAAKRPAPQFKPLHPLRDHLCADHAQWWTTPRPTAPAEGVLRFEPDAREGYFVSAASSPPPNVPALDSFDVCVVHGPCMDGVAAAMLVSSKRPDLPLLHTDHQRRALITDELRDKNVLFVDFSPKPSEVAAWGMRDYFALDHHPEALDLPEPRRFHRLRESGASLAWLYTHAFDTGAAPLPDYVRAVRAVDTGNKIVCPPARCVYTAVGMLRKDAALCMGCHAHALYHLDDMVTLDLLLAETERWKRCQALAATVRRSEYKGTPVLVLACGDFSVLSDTLSLALNGNADAVAVAWRPGAAPGDLVWSAQSEDEKRGLARALALSFGGGGHGTAAGFHTSGFTPNELFP